MQQVRTSVLLHRAVSCRVTPPRKRLESEGRGTGKRSPPKHLESFALAKALLGGRKWAGSGRRSRGPAAFAPPRTNPLPRPYPGGAAPKPPARPRRGTSPAGSVRAGSAGLVPVVGVSRPGRRERPPRPLSGLALQFPGPAPRRTPRASAFLWY